MDLPGASCCFYCMHERRCILLQVDELELAAIGPEFEKNAAFPARINTEFVEVTQACPKTCKHQACSLNGLHTTLSLDFIATTDLPDAERASLSRRFMSRYVDTLPCLQQVLSRSHVKMRVWERGAGATLACGTGACALVVAGVLEGRVDRNCRCCQGLYSIHVVVSLTNSMWPFLHGPANWATVVATWCARLYWPPQLHHSANA